MSICISDRETNLLRLRAQRLAPRSSNDASQLLYDLCCVQAQDSPAGTLSLGVRGNAFTATDAEHSRNPERSIIRIWTLRGTIHFHATQDIGWLHALVRSNIHKARSVRIQYGLDDALCDRYLDDLREIMSGKGAMSASEIQQGLNERGIFLVANAQLHLMHYASWKGLICMGPQRSAKPTYALLHEWITPGEELPRKEALRQLVRRYLSAYAPATPEDCACWSGLSLLEIREAWRSLSAELFAVENAGRTLWMLQEQQTWLNEPLPSTPCVRLLPAFDTYLLGYKKRELIIAAEDVRHIYQGSMIYPTLLIDGRVQGKWRSKKSGNILEITLEPFTELSSEVYQGLKEAVTGLEHFYGAEIALRIAVPGKA